MVFRNGMKPENLSGFILHSPSGFFPFSPAQDRGFNPILIDLESAAYLNLNGDLLAKATALGMKVNMYVEFSFPVGMISWNPAISILNSYKDCVGSVRLMASHNPGWNVSCKYFANGWYYNPLYK